MPLYQLSRWFKLTWRQNKFFAAETCNILKLHRFSALKIIHVGAFICRDSKFKTNSSQIHILIISEIKEKTNSFIVL